MQAVGHLLVGDLPNPRGWEIDRLLPIGHFVTTDVFCQPYCIGEHGHKGIDDRSLIAGVFTRLGDKLGVMRDFRFLHQLKVEFVLKPEPAFFPDQEINMEMVLPYLSLYSNKGSTGISLHLKTWEGSTVYSVKDQGRIAAFFTLEEEVPMPARSIRYVNSMILGSYWLFREAASLMKKVPGRLLEDR